MPDAAPAAQPMQCMEIWGGNQPRTTAMSTPGLDVWVHSTPFAGQRRGGDITYVSTCGSGRISRFAVADVAGHGDSVALLAAKLRRLMRKNINTLDQSRFARDLNAEFAALADAGRFATALLTTYFAPTDHLLLVNAGHPRPLLRSAATGRWRYLDPQSTDRDALKHDDSGATYWGRGVSNLPLGVIDRTEYEQFAVKLEPDDLVLLYTDAFIEARDPDGRFLGEAGLLELVSTHAPRDAAPEQVVPALLAATDRHRGGAPADDDQTLVALHHNATDPRPLTFRQAARSIARMVGLARV